MIKSFPAKKEDFRKINLRQCYSHDDTVLTRGASVVSLQGVYAHSIVADDGQVLAILGCNEQYPGVVRMWGITGEDITKYPVEFTKITKNLVRHYEKILKVHRSEMTVLTTFTAGVKWAYALGFTIESEMKAFGADKSDHFLFVRFPQWEQ